MASVQLPIPTLLLLLLAAASAVPIPPPLFNRYTIRGAPFPATSTNITDPTLPNSLPYGEPLCSITLLQCNSSFSSSNYTPPDPALCPWSQAFLDISFSAIGESPDRIAAVWLDGVELLRTATPVPTDAGVTWTAHKDVTRYSATLRSPGVVSVALESITTGYDSDTGVYDVNATVNFYAAAPIILNTRRNIVSRKLRKHLEVNSKLSAIYGSPADQIIPFANATQAEEEAPWVRLEGDNDKQRLAIAIPANTHRAVLEVVTSAHADEEFWYSNLPNYIFEQNNVPITRGNGSIRQVSITVDGLTVSTTVPFPAVYSGGLNPLLWTPIAPVGSFVLPSHDVELTPVLGWLLDGKQHEFAIEIVAAAPFWLVGANLHLWLDPNSAVVSAGLVRYTAPQVGYSTNTKLSPFQWEFEDEREVDLKLSGWVASSLGNLTTHVTEELEVEAKVTVASSGTAQGVEYEVEYEREVKVEEAGNELVKMKKTVKYPIEAEVKVEASRLTTKVSRGIEEKVTVKGGGVKTTSKVKNEEEGEGWMVLDQAGGAVVGGSVSVERKYSSEGGSSCYSRNVKVKDGVVTWDWVNVLCRAGGV